MATIDKPPPNKEKSPDRSPIPPMPKRLPVTEPEGVPGDPRPDSDPDEPFSPDVPPSPRHDPNP